MLLATSVVLIAIGMPLGFALALAALLAFRVTGLPAGPLVHYALADYSMVAIPLFVLAGKLAEARGFTVALIRLGRTLGTTGAVTAGAMLAAIGASPVASAEAASEVVRTAVERERAAGLAAGVAAMATIVPPAPTLILVALIGDISIVKLFLAALVPAVVLCMLLLLAVTSVAPLWRELETEQASALSEILSAGSVLAMPVVGLGVMIAGIATAVEAGAITVLYALFAPGHRLAWRDLVWAVRGTIVTTGALILLMLGATLATTLAARLGLLHPRSWPGADWPVLWQLVLAGVIALVAGMLLDVAPAVVIVVPALVPYAAQMALEPSYFVVSVMMAAAAGSTMYRGAPAVVAAAGIWEIEESQIGLGPIRIAFVSAWLAVTCVPSLTTWLPRLWLG